MKEKTIKEWLEELPDGYRERALANCDRAEDVASSMDEAIYCAFDWNHTSEGVDFWAHMLIYYRDFSWRHLFLPIIPTEK